MKRSAVILLAVALIMLFAVAAGARADFSDTAALNASEQAALKELSDRGVVNGYPDGTFRPAASVTRAEFAKMLCIYAGQDELKPMLAPFGDVMAADWFYGWVSRAAEQSWVNGYPGGTFKPRNSVTQQEVATVLVRLSGMDTEGFVWPDDYIEAAQLSGAFKGFVFVGVAAASRIITCQMFYNMLPKQETVPGQTAAGTVRGVVMELGQGSLTIKDGKGASQTYTAGANLLPDKLIAGSYLELAVSGQAVERVLKSILPQKGAFYWDVALDGKSALIEGKKYDLTEAEIFAVEYTLNKPYSSETFIKGGPIDRDILSLGGRLAAEMAELVVAEDGKLIAAYLVNVSLLIAGGRLDVVEGNYSSASGSGLYFLGREAGFPLELSGSAVLPTSGQFIHYTLKNGAINSCALLLDIGGGIIEDTTTILENAGNNGPYAWAGTNGAAEQNPLTLSVAKPKIIGIGSGRSTLQLGVDESDNINYWLADGCLIYEVAVSGKISQGSRSSFAKGQEAIALVNRNGDICYIFCFVD